MVDSASTSTHSVHGYRWTMWVDSGRETGPLRYPVAEVEQLPNGWIQRFQKGCIVDSTATPRAIVHNYAWAAWVAVGREKGPLGFPTGDRALLTRGYTQPFERGGLWGLTGRASYAVWGSVLDAWLAAGGPDGSYGYPTAHVVDNGNGTRTGVFEGGTITV